MGSSIKKSVSGGRFIRGISVKEELSIVCQTVTDDSFCQIGSRTWQDKG